MDFVYFIPGGRPGPATWPAALRDRIGRGVSARETISGPGDAGAGVYVSATREAIDALMADTDQWHWHEAPDGGDRPYRIGWNPACPPVAAELVRDTFIGGYAPELGDGNEWTVPLARAYPTGGNIPKLLVWGPDGPTEAPNPRFAELCEAAEQVWEAVQAAAIGQTGHMPTEQTARVALLALSTNYRLGPGECTVLELLTTDSAHLVCSLLVDLPGYLRDAAPELLDAAAKKNSPPEAGETAATPPFGGEA
jgi:hypothetical protein